jgi:DNA-binding HxlR family transcriptional regulator/putative sterol carrier protein
MTGIYGQFCPLAMATELLCNRWTMIVIREFLEGSTTFNDIARGIPTMSRNLLSQRLKELEAAGILSRKPARRGQHGCYQLTKAGEALGSVVRAMAGWGQEWIDVEPSLEAVDARLLMWDIRRNVKSLPDFPSRFTVHFYISNAYPNLREHWLVFEETEVDLCYIEPGHRIDVEIVADLQCLTKVWMGWEDFSEAIASGKLQITGDPKFASRARTWLGLSKLAPIPKRALADRVLRKDPMLSLPS